MTPAIAPKDLECDARTRRMLCEFSAVAEREAKAHENHRRMVAYHREVEFDFAEAGRRLDEAIATSCREAAALRQINKLLLALPGVAQGDVYDVGGRVYRVAEAECLAVCLGSTLPAREIEPDDEANPDEVAEWRSQYARMTSVA